MEKNQRFKSGGKKIQSMANILLASSESDVNHCESQQWLKSSELKETSLILAGHDQYKITNNCKNEIAKSVLTSNAD